MNREPAYKDYEGAMAKSQLTKIEKYARELNEMIENDDELESWVQSKLAKIDTYIGDVFHYMEYAYDKKFNEGGMIEKAKKIVGEDAWEMMDEEERMKIVENLKISGEIEDDDDDDDDEYEIEIEFDGKRVSYSVKVDGEEYEIYGHLNSYHTGRSREYEFEPDWFPNSESEDYYSENWEKIEDHILNAYHKK